MGQNRGLVLFTKIDPCIFKSPSTITVLCHSVLELIIERLQEARIPTQQNASLVQYYPFRNVSHSRPSPSLHSHEGPFLVNGQMPVSAEPGWGVKEQGQSGGESCPPPASPAWPGGNIGQLFPDLLFHKKPETQIWSEISQFLNLGNEFKKKKKKPLCQTFLLSIPWIQPWVPRLWLLPWSDSIAKLKVEIGLYSSVFIINAFQKLASACGQHMYLGAVSDPPFVSGYWNSWELWASAVGNGSSWTLCSQARRQAELGQQEGWDLDSSVSLTMFSNLRVRLPDSTFTSFHIGVAKEEKKGTKNTSFAISLFLFPSNLFSTKCLYPTHESPFAFSHLFIYSFTQ